MELTAASLSSELKSLREWIDRALNARLQVEPGRPDRLVEAMRYSVFAGGKRLRPLLVLLANQACNGGVEPAIPAACAVEMIHTYSLIHDDLPAMDDDDLRRGQPTCHRQFDEATAILAGDALLTLAFEVVCEIQPGAIASRCVRRLAQAVGPAGMVGGQMDDLNPPINADDPQSWLCALHSRKTGALITASLFLGGETAGANANQINLLGQFGQRIGLAFQIADDLLDVEGNAAVVGKQTGKDDSAGKLTFPGLVGVEESRRQARELIEEAIELIRPFGPAGSRLVELAQFIVERDS